MEIIWDYIADNYMTLMILAGFSLVLIVNHKTKIDGLQYAWGIVAIIFTLTICRSVEIWCDMYHKSYRILYLKTMLVYWLLPMVALLEIYLIVPLKNKWLISFPQIINMTVTFMDLFGTGIVYRFTENHVFIGGKFHLLPMVVLCFYVIFLTVCSVYFISNGSKSKGCILLFIDISAVITILGEYFQFAEGYAESVVALDTLIYYFYLVTICQKKVQEDLYQRELELEQSKTEMLMAQIRPHFLLNTLGAIGRLCKDVPEAKQAVDKFSHYLKGNLQSFSQDTKIPFERELTHTQMYLELEQLRFGDDLNIEYDLECTEFLLPPLTLEPLAENAVRHGIRGKESGKGTVTVSTREYEDRYEITVSDDGLGFDFTNQRKGDRKHIGLTNVKQRLERISNGTLHITSQAGKGSRVTIVLPKEEKRL